MLSASDSSRLEPKRRRQSDESGIPRPEICSERHENDKQLLVNLIFLLVVWLCLVLRRCSYFSQFYFLSQSKRNILFIQQQFSSLTARTPRCGETSLRRTENMQISICFCFEFLIPSRLEQPLLETTVELDELLFLFLICPNLFIAIGKNV